MRQRRKVISAQKEPLLKPVFFKKKGVGVSIGQGNESYRVESKRNVNC